MDYLRNYMSFVTRLPIGYKVGMLLFFSHMDDSLRQSYANLSRNLHSKSSVSSRDDTVVVVVDANGKHSGRRRLRFKPPREDTNQVTGRRSSSIDSPTQDDTNAHCLANLWPGIRFYRFVTTCLLTSYFLKNLSVALMLENVVFPLQWNCYLPGRLAIQVTLIKFVPMLATAMIACQLIWRYLALCSDTPFALDMIIFILSDDKLIEKEKARVAKINNTMRSRGNGNVIELKTVLQRVLFYRVTCDERTIYRLKPNRSHEMKSFLTAYIDVVCCITLSFLVIIIVVCVPFMVQCLLFDMYYAHCYPTCCPLIEKLEETGELSQWDVTMSRCKLRPITILFDVVDNFQMLFEAIFIYTLPLAVGVLSALDLGLYWLTIDSKIKDLLHHYRHKNFCGQPSLMVEKYQQQYSQHKHFLEPSSDFLTHYTRRSYDTAFELSNHDDPFYGEIINLQALIVDFFENFRRCNRFSGKIITYSVILFFAGIFMCAYCSTKIPNFWDLYYIWFLMSVAYISFFTSSLIMLYLKRIIDQSYPNICSLMAMDRSPNAMKWIHIVEVYVHRHGTAFSLLYNVRFTWQMVFNLIASSISCFILLETYKRYYYANLKPVQS